MDEQGSNLAPIQLSVIIPTCNRKSLLRQALESLVAQGLPGDAYEVIVVDDGTPGGVEELLELSLPYRLTILKQQNSGATSARNRGAQHSQGEVLVFLDDDIAIHPGGLAALLAHCQQNENTVYLGALTLPDDLQRKSIFARLSPDARPVSGGDEPISFQFCTTGLLGVRRKDFFAQGMFQNPTGGWPNWDDVDFGYRLSQEGYQFMRCTHAVGEHHDYAMLSLEASCERLYRASQSAVALFRRHPELQRQIPMFRDALPVDVRADPAGLVVRKLLRRVSSTRLALKLLDGLRRWLERSYPNPGLLRSIYRWICGGTIYRGYQQGLKDLRVRQEVSACQV